jgi:hypothetical protein
MEKPLAIPTLVSSMILAPAGLDPTPPMDTPPWKHDSGSKFGTSKMIPLDSLVPSCKEQFLAA